MDESQIISRLTGGSSESPNILQNLQSSFEAAFWVGIVLSIILTIFFIINAILKIRVQSAILRMDKNLQKLVDQQVPAKEEVAAVDKVSQSDIEQTEQN